MSGKIRVTIKILPFQPDGQPKPDAIIFALPIEPSARFCELWAKFELRFSENYLHGRKGLVSCRSFTFLTDTVPQ